MDAKQKPPPREPPVTYRRKVSYPDFLEEFVPIPKQPRDDEYERERKINDFIKESNEASSRLVYAMYKTIDENKVKETTINELNSQLSGLEEGAKSALFEIQTLKEQLDKLEAVKNEAQSENVELNSAIAGLRADIETKTKEYNNVVQQYQTATATINQLAQDIEQNKKTIAAYEAQLADVKENLGKAIAERERLRVELENASRAYGELRASYDQSVKDYDMVSGSLVAVRGEKQTLQKNLQAEQAKNADLEAKYKTTSEDHNRLKKDYDFVYDANEKNEQRANRLLEQYDKATRKINVLRTGNDLQQKRIVALEDNVKGLEANAKLREALVGDLTKQAKESESLRNKLVQVTTDLNNTIVSRDQAIAAAVEQENRRLHQLHEKAIDKVNKDLQSRKGKNKKLKEKLETAGVEKQVALEQQKREFLSKINALGDERFAEVEALNRKHAAELADLNKTLFEQEGLRKAAVEDKIALEKEIKAKINEKEKLIDQLKRQKDELKDAQTALKNLKDKFGEQDLLKKQIANYEEQKIELENEIKVHKDNLSKLRKADKQLDSSPPSGFDFFGPAPIRQSRPRRTNANSFFPPPSYSFPPPSYYSPPPPPPSNNFFPSTSYYNPPPPPNYNPAPPSYLPKWPGDSNKLTLEIKVAGGEGGTRAGLESNLSPVSRPRGDIISKLPFGPYGIEIFQPEKFRKMDTKQDKKKGKKQPTPYQIARSVGKSLFRNLDPLRVRKTSVGTDTTYHAIERTPAMFETFGRSTKRRKVTRIY